MSAERLMWRAGLRSIMVRVTRQPELAPGRQAGGLAAIIARSCARVWPVSAARGLPGSFWVLWIGTLVNRLGYMVEPFLAYYLTGIRGLSLDTSGAVLAAVGAGSVVSQLAAGVLADRLGRRATLALGMLSNACALVALGYARGVAPIVLAALLFGATVNIYRPAAAALVADLVQPGDRPRAYGLLFWAVNIGFSAAMVAGGILARTGFAWLFWMDAVTCIAFGLIVWRGIPNRSLTRSVGAPDRQLLHDAPSRPGTAARPRRGGPAGGLRRLGRDRVMSIYLGLTLCYCFVYLQAYTTLPLAMRLRGLPPDSYGLAIAVNGVLIVVAQPLASSWLSARDKTTALAAGIVIIGLGFGLTTAAGSTLAYAATVVVWTLGEIVTAGLGQAIVADLAPAHLRGLYSGAYGSVWSAAYLIGPLAGTRLLAIGAPVLWLGCASICIAAAMALLALGPGIRQRSSP